MSTTATAEVPSSSIVLTKDDLKLLKSIEKGLSTSFHTFKVIPTFYCNLETLWKEIQERHKGDKDFKSGLALTSTRVVCALPNKKIAVLHDFSQITKRWTGQVLEENIILQWGNNRKGFKIKRKWKDTEDVFDKNKIRFPEYDISTALIFQGA